MDSHHRTCGYRQRRLKGQTLRLAPQLIAILLIGAVGVCALLITMMASHSDPWSLDHLTAPLPVTPSPEAIIDLPLDDDLNDQLVDPLDRHPDATLPWPAVGIVLAMIGLNVLVIWRFRLVTRTKCSSIPNEKQRQRPVVLRRPSTGLRSCLVHRIASLGWIGSSDGSLAKRQWRSNHGFSPSYMRV